MQRMIQSSKEKIKFSFFVFFIEGLFSKRKVFVGGLSPDTKMGKK